MVGSVVSPSSGEFHAKFLNSYYIV